MYDSITMMDLVSLKVFDNALEDFKQDIISHCDKLETGINGCAAFMKDKNSQNALAGGRQVSSDIRKCLVETDKLLDIVKKRIKFLEQVPEVNYGR